MIGVCVVQCVCMDKKNGLFERTKTLSWTALTANETVVGNNGLQTVETCRRSSKATKKHGFLIVAF